MARATAREVTGDGLFFVEKGKAVPCIGWQVGFSMAIREEAPVPFPGKKGKGAWRSICAKAGGDDTNAATSKLRPIRSRP